MLRGGPAPPCKGEGVAMAPTVMPRTLNDEHRSSLHHRPRVDPAPPRAAGTPNARSGAVHPRRRLAPVARVGPARLARPDPEGQPEDHRADRGPAPPDGARRDRPGPEAP